MSVPCKSDFRLLVSLLRTTEQPGSESGNWTADAAESQNDLIKAVLPILASAVCSIQAVQHSEADQGQVQ